MKFWIVEDSTGDIVSCWTSRTDAKADAASYPGSDIRWIEVPVNAESIRRLLGNHGGYATDSQQ